MLRHALEAAIIASCISSCGLGVSAQTLPPDLQRLNRQQQMSILIGWLTQTASICRFDVNREAVGRIIAGYGITQEQLSTGGELVHFIGEGGRNASENAQRHGVQAFCAGQWRDFGPGAGMTFFTGRRPR